MILSSASESNAAPNRSRESGAPPAAPSGYPSPARRSFVWWRRQEHQADDQTCDRRQLRGRAPARRHDLGHRSTTRAARALKMANAPR